MVSRIDGIAHPKISHVFLNSICFFLPREFLAKCPNFFISRKQMVTTTVSDVHQLSLYEKAIAITKAIWHPIKMADLIVIVDQTAARLHEE